MRTLSLILFGLILLAGPVLAGEDHPLSTPSGWFDFENCVFCKNLIKDPELLHHSTWEESAEQAFAAMEQVGMEMQTGKRNPMTQKMCGSCKEWGMLMMAGVQVEEVKGKGTAVTLMTSDDPALVKRLHDLVDRNNEEMAILMKAAGGDGHDYHHDHGHGHDHDHDHDHGDKHHSH